jgi:hypothetical protein
MITTYVMRPASRLLRNAAGGVEPEPLPIQLRTMHGKLRGPERVHTHTEGTRPFKVLGNTTGLSAKALSHSPKPSPRGNFRRKSHVDAPPVMRPSPRASLDPLGGHAPRGVLGSRRRPSYRHGAALR